MYDPDEIDGLADVVVGYYETYKRYARQQVLAKCTAKQRKTLKQVEARVLKVRERASEAFQARLEQARIEAKLDPSELARLADRRRGRDMRIESIEHTSTGT